MGKIVLMVGIVLFLAGCGADWMPDDKPTQIKVERTSVGAYQRSTRTGPSAFIVTTALGAFSTYTSLSAQVGTTVSLDQYTDTQSGYLIGKVLSASGKSILVKVVLNLAK